MSHSHSPMQPEFPPSTFWHVPLQETPLPPGHIHVWRGMVDLPPARLQACQDTVSTDEQARAQRLTTSKHRRRFIAARGMLRHILSRYLRMPPRDLRFGVGPYGKPFLDYPAGQPLYFNMAHSHHRAVYAVSRDFEVGIDLEGNRDRTDYRRLAERICSPAELTTLQQLPQDTHQAAFLTCWTRKEAFVKAEGTGLAFPLKHLTVSFAPDDPPHILHIQGRPPVENQWSLVDLPLEKGFWGAVAIKGHPDLVQGWDCDLSDSSGSGE
ncbi:MAG: 4'-phosphopantetheinyl transferase superfamily protein [Nitrospira sp.]|nr:4'-phosphopantetheinyl transferase superfamily protein [Nitrospira sp.]